MTNYALRKTRLSDGLTWVETPDHDGEFSLHRAYIRAEDVDALKAAILVHNDQSTYTSVELLEATYAPVVVEPPVPTEPGVYTPHPEAPQEWRLYLLDDRGRWTRLYNNGDMLGGLEAQEAAAREFEQGRPLVRLTPAN